MAELTEIPLELQLKEANRQIKMHLSKGRKFQQFLSPMFLRRFSSNHGKSHIRRLEHYFGRLWQDAHPSNHPDWYGNIGWLVRPPSSVGRVTRPATRSARVGPRPLYTTDPVQGSTCHSVWGVLHPHSRLPSTHEPARRPDIPEEHQGRLRSPGSDAISANILSPTTEGQVFDSASYQWQPRRGSRSLVHLRCCRPPRG